jgi:transposase
MAAQTKTMEQIRIILQHHASGRSIRWIAASTGASRNTVRGYIRLVLESGQSASQALSASDEQLAKLVFDRPPPPEDARSAVFTQLLAYWTKELARAHVTRQILWREYRLAHPDGYGYTRFCHLLNAHLSRNKLSAVLHHRLGHELMVDFAGDKLSYTDPSTGEVIGCEVFVAVLPASGYIYVEAVPSQRQEHFVGAIVNTLHAMGGVPKLVVCDNLRSAVSRTNRYEPTFTELTEQLSLHYSTAFSAARVRRPKDKAAVEGAVKTAYTLIYAAIRNEHPTSLRELNALLGVHLHAVNERKIRDRTHSRAQLLEQELECMTGLPHTRFEVKKTVMAKVQKNYHVILGEDMHQYSVPYRHAGSQVKLVYSALCVEIYHEHRRIAVHERRHRKHGYSTLAEHMPANHRTWHEQRGWDAAHFERQAKRIGVHTHACILELLQSRAFPEQTYNACLGVLRLAHTYGNDRLEAACALARQGARVSYGTLSTILKNNRDKLSTETEYITPANENVRGANYYA